jgi:Mrp family chromosome partitioning ATPase
MSGTRTVDALRRFWWIVAAFTLTGALLGGLPSDASGAESATRWNARHTLLVSRTSQLDSVFSDSGNVNFSQLQLFLTTGEVPARVADLLDYAGQPAALAAQITVTADPSSGSLRIATEQDSADRAVDVADAFANELVAYLAERQDALRQDRLAATLSRLEELDAELQAAQARVRLEPLDATAQAERDALSRQYSVVFEQFNVLQAEQGQIVLTTLERAQPVAVAERGLRAPTSRVGRMLFGGIAGLVLGIAVATALARSDRRIRTREQAEELVGIGAHAVIPAVSDYNPNELVVVPERHDPLSDSYRTLRSVISFLEAGKTRSATDASVVLVVSPGSGDGKTSVTANLTAAFVETGVRTVAINADFRRPALSKRLIGYKPEPILIDPDSDRWAAPLEFVLTPTDFEGLSVMDLAGMPERSPGDLARITSGLLPRVAAGTDAIIIDTSPVGATAEVLEFVPLADVIVVVVRLGHTSIQATRRAVDMVRTLSTADILLVLVGGSGSESSAYYYYYSTATERAPRRFGRKQTEERSTVS